MSHVAYNDPQLCGFEPIRDQFKEACLSPKSRELDSIPSSLFVDCLEVLLPHVTQEQNQLQGLPMVTKMWKSLSVEKSDVKD